MNAYQLSTILHNSQVSPYSHLSRNSYSYDDPLNYTHIFEIPFADGIEVPFFIISLYNKFFFNKLYDKGFKNIAIPLFRAYKFMRYRTLPANFKDCFSSAFSLYGLKMLTNEPKGYYASPGIIFDSDYKALCAFTVKTHFYDKDGHLQLEYVDPLFRVAPEAFFNKNDNVCKFIRNSLIPYMLDLDTSVWVPNNTGNNSYTYDRNYCPIVCPHVDIGSIGLNIFPVSEPSISVTNDTLLKVVSDNLEDIDIDSET